MGVSEVELVLKDDIWMDAEEVAKKVGITSGNARIILGKLVTKWQTAEVKKELVNHCWRSSFRLKGGDEI